MAKTENYRGLLFKILPFILILLCHWYYRDYLNDRKFENRSLEERIRREDGVRLGRNDPKRKALDLVRTGRKLSSEQVERFEERATEGTLSEDGRARLIGYYGRLGWQNEEARSAHSRHVLWFVENQPESHVLQDHSARLMAGMSLPAYIRAKALWVQHLENSPENLTIKANAVSMLMYGDGEFCIDIINDAERLDPKNGDWPKKLGQIYKLQMSSRSSKVRRQAALRSLDALERSHPLLPEIQQIFVLEDIVDLAYLTGQTAKANQLARELVEMSGPMITRGRTTHIGETILGLLSLDEGDVDSAKAHLIASVTFPRETAGNLPTSRPLRLAQVDYRLARRLIEEGEWDTVRQFIEKGQSHFGLAERHVPEWLDSLDEGLVPNFGR